MKTPTELWSGTPANYAHLRIFVCLSYARVKQDKLEPRTLRCIFIGYPEGVKDYKVWNIEPTGPRCFNTRDITFDESRMGFILKKAHIKGENDENMDSQIEMELPESRTSPQTEPRPNQT